MSDEPQFCEVERCNYPDMIVVHHPIRLRTANKVTAEAGTGETIEDSTLVFLRTLAAIPGVIDVSSVGYAVQISKGRVFPWGPIIDAVTREFRDFYGIGYRERTVIGPGHTLDFEVR